MIILKDNVATSVCGGKLINGGYSGHPGWATSAIRPELTKKYKRRQCIAASITAGGIAGATGPVGGAIAGGAAAAVCSR